MSRKQINLAIALDQKYFMGALVAVTSTIKNLNPIYRLDVFIIDCGMLDTEKLRQALLPVSRPEITLHFITHSLDDYKEAKIVSEHITSAAFAVMNLPGILTGINRVIYLDSDVIVTGDLARLWETELMQHGIGAVSDTTRKVLSDDIQNCDDLEYDPQSPYFNSGVMLIDLEFWRKMQLEDQLTSLLDDTRIVRCCNDQSFLNIAFQNRWTALEPRWNQITVLKDNYIGFIGLKKGIIHCVMNLKPWHFEEKDAKGTVKLFYKYLKITGLSLRDWPTAKLQNPYYSLENLYIGLRFYLQELGLDAFRLFRFLKRA